jgi:TPR repeat protein
VVRNFPFQLPQGRFRGRYRLNILWPATARMSDPPMAKSIDNPFFFVSEEFTLRGNYLSYLVDYRLKSDQVAAKDMPELSVQAKRLHPFASGKWRVADAGMALQAASGYSYRNFETVLDGQAIKETGARLGKLKKGEMPMEELCDLARRAVRFAELEEPGAVNGLEMVSFGLLELERTPGARRCRAMFLFAKGRFAESVPLFEAEAALKDDDALTPTLAWARFYAGDGKGALADMARYRVARTKSGELTAIDVANSIALLERLAQPILPELSAYAVVVPDGPWPRPLVAMQAGALSEAGLFGAVAALPGDARELALNDAWFFIGQRRLAAQNKAGAEQAFRWFLGNGIRGTREYWLAKHELTLFETKDDDYLEGLAAFSRKDYAAAVGKWRRSADRKSAPAQYAIGRAYFNGNGVKQDYSEAMRWCRIAAEQGSPGAMNLVGSMLLDGLGAPKDSSAAFEWHRRAAELGDENALWNLGNAYQDGTALVASDPVKAFAYYRQSAELGNAYAQAELAGMYSDGSGTVVDFTQAVFWAGRASRHGSTDGHRRLARLYREGKGVPKDLERAAKLTRAAAEAGNLSAMADLAELYETGAGVAKDSKLAIMWFEKAAQQGHLISQLLLGRRYRDGAGVAADAARAIAWIEKSATGGYPLAYSYLGEMFMNGIGVPKDAARAIGYWRQGAQQGDRFCQQDLALALHFGNGVVADFAGAVAWYRKAADQGMELSSNNLADMYENGRGVAQDYDRAVSLYRQAASAGLPTAFVSLASLYEAGHGVPASPAMAYAYYQLGVNAQKDSNKNAAILARRDKAAAQLNTVQLADATAIAAAWELGKPLPGESGK